MSLENGNSPDLVLRYSSIMKEYSVMLKYSGIILCQIWLVNFKAGLISTPESHRILHILKRSYGLVFLTASPTLAT